MPVTDLLQCPTCGHIDTVYVEYNCIPGLHVWTEPPRPAGHPATRQCPGCSQDGGGPDGPVDPNGIFATGRVVACTACTEGGMMTEMARD